MRPCSSVADRRVGDRVRALIANVCVHIMLMELKTKPAVGETLMGSLKLDDGTMVPFKAEVRK